MLHFVTREQIVAATEALGLNPQDVYGITIKGGVVIVDIVDRNADGSKVRNNQGGLCLTTRVLEVY